MPAGTGKPQAIVALLRREDRFLVIKRGPQASRSGHWAPLSGRMEPGESQADAVAREVHEEIGLRVRPLAKVWECDTDDGRFLLHWWTAEPEPDSDLVLDPGEVSEARWVTRAEFLGMRPTFAGDREFFQNVFPAL